MKKIFYIICCLSIVVLLSACDDDDDTSSSGGSGAGDVSWNLYTDDDGVTCYNADKNVIIKPYQYCEWYCSDFYGDVKHVKVTFFHDIDEDLWSVFEIEDWECSN